MGKQKNSRKKINASIGQNRFTDIDWLISVDINFYDNG